MMSKRGGSLELVTDGFHRRGQAPICLTRYPTLPRGCRVLGKGGGKSAKGNNETRLREAYKSRLNLLSSHARDALNEVIVEINCVSSVASEVLMNCHAIINLSLIHI